ncbi:hypothetical protein [Lactobacillus buchneri CD034] [Lactiplantibacillus mudanjiangensis]|uniref:hypothetical protein n=1 Tax=Lactiplantibacillus mudanjiangensis TaxID=1296538 RepID=UPI001013F4C1|nr:hypothetical protein [Lactiplantibacillus mudanjiangensis]VDG31411.1 hypothetical protein [Lactobacillus buchneri CD034] [Lactiplantibacillus mudanjiangensis]
MTETKQDDNLLKIMKEARHDETIKFKTSDGKDGNRKATYEDPGIGIAMRIMDLMNTGDDEGDFGKMFQDMMSQVLIEPRWTYEDLEKGLPESLHKKQVAAKNKVGKDVKIEMVWPGYRTALQMTMMLERPSGASNMHDTLVVLNREVFRHNGQPVRMEYWEMGHEGYGLGMKAFSEATEYLRDVLDYNGVLETLTTGLRFLSNTVRF